MIKELCIATKNEGKLAEFREMLKVLPVELHSLNEFADIADAPETGKSLASNARKKALFYAKATGMPCLADDSGLECVALNGAPGVLSARYSGENATDDSNIEKLLNDMLFCVRRSCRFRCVLCVALPNGRVMYDVDGVCDGMLLHKKEGSLGFGYDPIFWSTELHMSFGEASAEEKNAISHRAKAVKRLVSIWKKKNK